MLLTGICVIKLFEIYCANISHSSDNPCLLITLSKSVKGSNCFRLMSDCRLEVSSPEVDI